MQVVRTLAKALGIAALALAVGAAFLWLFGPYEQVDLEPEFDPRKFGEGVQVYFESVESAHDDITPGTEKRVVWQDGFKERRTRWSVLYLHGFSATSEELRPVPDRIADALGANLVFTRLTGHGRPGPALAEASAPDWTRDLAEGLAAARAVGDRVVVVSTSTGATLAAVAALNPDLSQGVAAMILVSPNFGINDPAAFVLTWPAARTWLPWFFGPQRSWQPVNELQARFWTTTYPWSALPPMAALVDTVAEQDFSKAVVPALFWFSDADTVVRPEITHGIAARWGAPATVHLVKMGQGDDPAGHVVAGDILSPGQTEAAVSGMLKWLREQGIE